MTNNIQLSFISMIGNGNFCDFIKAIWKRDKDDKDIVVVRLQEIPSETLIQKEFEVLSKVNHENVLKLYAIIPDKIRKNVMMVMESVDCGSFSNYLHRRGKKNQTYKFFDMVNWMHQIAKGCEYLHKLNPQKRDNQLMTCNMLLSFNYRTIKIVYFGSFGQSIDKFLTNGDVFCFGIVLWELLSGEDPYSPEHIGTFDDGRLPLDTIVNDENSVPIKKLIERCWHNDPRERITMGSLADFFDILYQQLSGRTEEVAWSEVEIHKPAIGEGGFSKVFTATWITKYRYTRKIVAKKLRSNNAEADIAQEVTFLSLINHENIIKLYGITRNPKNRIYILTEYAECGTVDSYLHSSQKEPRSLSDLGKLNWLLQLTQAVACLHGMNPKILHRDLKTANILLTNNYKTIKLCDFGLARTLATKMTKEAGTIAYMAPELANLDGTTPLQEYTEKCDVYSFGIILWEIMSGEDPSLGRIPFALQFGVVFKDLRPPVHELNLSDKLEYLKQLAEGCWNKDPSKRPTMKEVSFIFGVDPNSFQSSILELRSLPPATDKDY